MQRLAGIASLEKYLDRLHDALRSSPLPLVLVQNRGKANAASGKTEKKRFLFANSEKSS